VVLSANHIFSANNARETKRPKNLRFFSGAHRSAIGKNILNSEKPLFQQLAKIRIDGEEKERHSFESLRHAFVEKTARRDEK
jgi:hypothetical protein